MVPISMLNVPTGTLAALEDGGALECGGGIDPDTATRNRVECD